MSIRLLGATVNGKNRSEYVYLAYLTEPREIGKSTKRSPQHLTLVPPFQFDNPLSELRDVVHEVAADTRAIPVKVARESKLGPNRSIDVRLIEPVDAVRALHRQLMYKLESKGVLLPTKYVYDAFLPHITLKPAHTTDLQSGQILTINHIAIMHKSKDLRTLLAKEELKT